MSAFSNGLEAGVLTILRLALSAWVGGAALFVITSVAEQTSPLFGSVARDQLATIRFPLYYQFGFAALAISIFSGLLLLIVGRTFRRSQLLIVLTLTILSFAGAVADYVWVYRPLQQLIEPPGQVRDQQFVTLHYRSRHANEIHVTLALLAAVAACIPFSRRNSAAISE